MSLPHLEFFLLHSDLVVVDILLELIEQLRELDLYLVVLGLHSRQLASDLFLLFDDCGHVVSEKTRLVQHSMNITHLHFSF